MVKRIGDDIREILVKAGVTQTELSAGTGLALSNINRIVNNKVFPNVWTLETIANYLGISVRAFYDETIRNNELAARHFKMLPDYAQEALFDESNWEYIKFGISCRYSDIPLQDLKELVEKLKEQAKK